MRLIITFIATALILLSLFSPGTLKSFNVNQLVATIKSNAVQLTDSIKSKLGFKDLKIDKNEFKELTDLIPKK